MWALIGLIAGYSLGALEGTLSAVRPRSGAGLGVRCLAQDG